ncbi:MAG: hypothetical protein IJJ85_10970 [Clostridia bacterium]|nr:hypothetical protein [Clostridia bacterium]
MIITTQDVLQVSASDLRFSDAETGYSPLFSNIGLQADKETDGVGSLWLYYNRCARAVFNRTVDLPLPLSPERSGLHKLVFGNGEAVLSFYDTDSFLFRSIGIPEIPLFREPDGSTQSLWIEDPAINPKLCGLSGNGDGRDPDGAVPFKVFVEVKKGRLFAPDAKNISVSADENGDALFSVQFRLPDAPDDLYQKPSPDSIDAAAAACKAWLEQNTAALSLPCPDARAVPVIAAAVRGLLFNCAKAPGLLKKRVSAFPNRGTYPTHFLWDACFQNLAYELINPALARDFLLLFKDTQRTDGKYGQFLCSTWVRPHDSQPPLIGWAALRYVKRTGDLAFAKEILPSIEKNIHWWLTYRMTDTGLIYTLGGLETGQDDSPRFDNGPTIPCDMNAFLLSAIWSAVELRNLIGEKNGSGTDRYRYCSGTDFFRYYAKRIVDVLYDREDGIFYDLDLKTRQRVKIASPSSFLPLWIPGNGLSGQKAAESIRKYLTNEKKGFGAVPFPSVFCDEPTYRSDAWWRGPTWLPIAWLMLETLLQYDMMDEFYAAAKRLYGMLLEDPGMHELFDSKTGKGLGSAQQGWTCAIFMKLNEILSNSKEDGAGAPGYNKWII